MENSPLIKEGQVVTLEFKCRICAKAFDNRKSQVRHTSYCKRAKTRIRPPRKRACFICAKAKTYCDAHYPKCTRCDTNGLTCGYERPELPISAPVVPLQSPQNGWDASFSLPSLDSDSWEYYDDLRVSNFLPSRNSTSVPEIPPPYPSNDQSLEIVTIAGTSQQQIASSEPIVPYEPDHYASIDMSFKAFLQPTPGPEMSGIELPVFSSQTLVPFSPDLSNWEAPGPLDFDQIIPKAPRSFWPRPSYNNLLALNRSFVICTLRSYVYMMIPNKSLPPFIHSLCLIDLSGDNTIQKGSLPKPLALCAALVRWHSVKNKDNKSYVWTSIRMEIERLSSIKYNDVDAVAALQAVTIYFLLRVSEDDTDATNFDIPLIQTMLQLARQVSGIIVKYSKPKDGGRPLWQGWLLAESLRRTIIVLFLVDLLFDISIGVPPHACNGSQLASMVLPCARGLWKASTKSEWEREYDAQFRGPKVEKQLTYGDLLNLRFKANGTLDSWLSQLDDFGMLVMAAASIPDERNNQ